MPIALVATPGASNANSFVSELAAITRAATRLNLPSAWTTVTGSDCTESEKKALISATNYLNPFGWKGDRVDVVQVLAWPRQNVWDPDAPTAQYISPLIIPVRVIDATVELAFAFLAGGTTDPFAIDPTQGVIEKTVDVLTTRWAEPSQRPSGLSKYPQVLTLIDPLLEVSSGQVRLVR